MSRKLVELFKNPQALRSAMLRIARASSPLAAESKVKAVEPIVAKEVKKIFQEHAISFDTANDIAKLSQISQKVQDLIQSSNPASTANPPLLKPQDLRKLVEEGLSQMAAENFSKKSKVLVFGFGNMASAICGKLEVDVTAIVGEESKSREKQKGVSYLSKTNPLYRETITKVPGDVLLAVKPKQLEEIAPDLKVLRLEDDAMAISVLAGISTKILQKLLPENTAILRTMPNTPMSVGFGVTGVYLPPEMAHKQFEIFKYFGEGNNQVVFVDREEEIDYVTGLSGSGPAYYFKLAEEIAKANPNISEKKVFEIMKSAFREVKISSYQPQNTWQGSIEEMAKIAGSSEEVVKDFVLSFTQALYKKALAMNFSKQDAETLAVGTATGAGVYGYTSEKSAEKLRVDVTSPGGTTEEALKVLNKERASLDEIVANTVQAASNRAAEIGRTAEEKFLKDEKTVAAKVVREPEAQLMELLSRDRSGRSA